MIVWCFKNKSLTYFLVIIFLFKVKIITWRIWNYYVKKIYILCDNLTKQTNLNWMRNTKPWQKAPSLVCMVPLDLVETLNSLSTSEEWLLLTYLPLGYQFSLRSRSSFHQSAGGSGDGLGGLEDLLLKVQALVSLLFTREENQQPINTPLLGC